MIVSKTLSILACLGEGLRLCRGQAEGYLNCHRALRPFTEPDLTPCTRHAHPHLSSCLVYAIIYMHIFLVLLQGKKNYVPTGIRTRVEGSLRNFAPQASGMSTTPSGQNIPHGMLQVIKLVGLRLWSGPYEWRAESRSCETLASRGRKSMRRTHCRWPARARSWRCDSPRPS